MYVPPPFSQSYTLLYLLLLKIELQIDPPLLALSIISFSCLVIFKMVQIACSKIDASFILFLAVYKKYFNITFFKYSWFKISCSLSDGLLLLLFNLPPISSFPFSGISMYFPASSKSFFSSLLISIWFPSGGEASVIEFFLELDALLAISRWFS